MRTNQDYINYYEKVIKTNNYNTIQGYFKNNDCVNHKIVGHMTYLCRQSKAKEFSEWVKYYDTTPYAKNFGFAVEKLQERLKENKLDYTDEVVAICLKAFLLYQTWIGVEQEKAVMKLLADKNFYCLYPQSDMQEYLSNPHYTTATAGLGVLLLFQTGLRVGELVALRDSNIDDKFINIDAEEQREYDIIVDEETNEVTCVYKGTTVGAAKTDASYRRIPLTAEAKYLINLIRQTNKENGYKTEDFLFVNANQRMQENTILKHIYKYCDRAFIDRRSPHKARKTFASLLINNGHMDLSEVALLMGHTDEKTLINHYLFSTKEEDTRLSRMESSLVV